MAKFRKKPVVVEASKWSRLCHHDAVSPLRVINKELALECEHCHRSKGSHGWIETLEGGHIVCPGDWIITGVAGENYPCKPDIFDATYEPAEGEK